jgi:hypothetical protein
MMKKMTRTGFFEWPVSGQEVEPGTQILNRDFGWKGQTVDAMNERNGSRANVE